MPKKIPSKRRTKEDGRNPIKVPAMSCESCCGELVMPGSREAGLCNPCREALTPKYIPDCQYDSYWGAYSEKRNS